jgi:hypothetical protein
MNKFLTAVASLAFVFNLQAQSIGFVDTKELHEYVENDLLKDGFKSCKIKFFNNTDADITIKYKKVSVDFPESWSVSFCDNSDCYPSFVDEAQFRPISAGDTVDLKLDVYPDGTADTAYVSYAIWDEANPNVVDTLNYQIMSRWGLFSENLKITQVSVFPNPTSDVLNIRSMSAIEQVSVLDLNGKLVYSEKISEPKSSVTLPLASLPNGLYVIETTTLVGVESQKFQIRK